MRHLVVSIALCLAVPAAFAASPAATAALERATALAKEKNIAAIDALIEAIEADPDLIAAHELLREVVGQLRFEAARTNQSQEPALAADRRVQAKYEEWEKRFPDSIGVAFGIGARLSGKEDPGARKYLLKVVQRDPKLAKAWFMLAMDAERWGEERQGSEYMLKASQADPENPDYAFYYASGLDSISREKWEAASRAVAKRFPQSERGAQAFYWLGQKAESDEKRIAVWEQGRADFPATKFNWTAGAMGGLYDAYLRRDPAKAIALANELATQLPEESAKEWVTKREFAETYVQVRDLLKNKRAAEALPLLDKLPVARRSSNPTLITVLKGEVLAAAGKPDEAYQLLLKRYAESPDDALKAPLVRLASARGQGADAVEKDAWKLRAAAATPAPGFNLGLYSGPGTLSLEQLRGKVVFLTFWFPGCGPCRGEFPHFERVVQKFKGRDDLVYVGINGIRDQDEYVNPFMKGTGYSFIPLKGEEAVTGKEGYGVRGYPANYLIDRNGRIIYRNFRTHDAASELELQRMIESLLAQPAGV
jgi:thiol-disulfide isomerase/thioredoxin